MFARNETVSAPGDTVGCLAVISLLSHLVLEPAVDRFLRNGLRDDLLPGASSVMSGFVFVLTSLDFNPPHQTAILLFFPLRLRLEFAVFSFQIDASLIFSGFVVPQWGQEFYKCVFELRRVRDLLCLDLDKLARDRVVICVGLAHCRVMVRVHHRVSLPVVLL